MFSFIKDKLSKIYNQFTAKLAAIFKSNTIDEQTLNQLESLLISSDLGVKTTKFVIEKLKQKYSEGKIKQGQDLKQELEQILSEILNVNKIESSSNVIVLVGINGSGKTTFAAKLAQFYKVEGNKVLLVAADTFRAAAKDQLSAWANKINVHIELGKEHQDPASVIYTGCFRFKEEDFNTLIIDTAGRLQTKINLMKELEKIKKVIERQLPNNKILTLLTIDAMLGQNSLEQAKLFNESTKLDGLVLTKMDGTGKAGIVFSIVKELGIPVFYISYGESLEQFKEFDAKEFITQILSE